MSQSVPSEIESGAPSLDDLFGAHYERVTRVIGRVIHDQARAEELAVEVFLKWSRNPNAHGGCAEGWVYRAAVRVALDELRRQTRRLRFEKLFAPFLRPPPTPAQLHEAACEREHVRAVLAAMNSRAASVLLLWAEELSYREMATALEINPNSVGSLLSRAQETFRKEYVKRNGTEFQK